MSMTFHPRRSAFTLVELLVVISIIGILMGLLLPGVQAAREAMRRAECGNQIRQFGIAATHYENTKGHYPGYASRFVDFEGGPDPADPMNFGGAVPGHEKRGTWMTSLLPYLEQQPVYEIWSLSRYSVRSDGSGDYPATQDGYSYLATPNLAISQCPSSPVTTGDRAKNNYISNNGMHPARSITLADSMQKANGIFGNRLTLGHNPTNPNDLVELATPVRSDDIKDGLSHTVLFSENLQAQPWYQHAIPATTVAWARTQRSGKWRVPYHSQSRYIHGMVWHYEDNAGAGGAARVNPVHLINGGNPLVDPMTAANCVDFARPSSAHNDGVNMVFAGGQTRFVRDSIDYRTYQALMTPRGKSSDVPFTEHVLTDDDF